MKKTISILSLISVIVAFQNCSQGFRFSEESEGALASLSSGTVRFNVRYDATSLNSPVIQGGQLSADQLMARLKYKGCMFDGLLTDNAATAFADLLARSACESLPRAIETWANPPDFNFVKTQMNIVAQRSNSKTYDYGMFVAEAISLVKPYRDARGKAFDFAAMCKPNTQGQWGANTCVPDFANPEYQAYVKFIVKQAISLGVTNILFGQTGHQDPGMRLPALLVELRAEAAAQGRNVIFGQQPNGHQPEAYLKAFDFIVGPVFVDRDDSQTCIELNGACQVVHHHPELTGRAHNVIAEIDWYSGKDDDTHRFARKSAADRKAYLDSKTSELFGRGVGFLMPFRLWLTGDTSGANCYGQNEYIYSPHREFGCKDEDFINSILRGDFTRPVAEPALSVSSAQAIVKEHFKTILDRTPSEMTADTEGVDYWVQRLRAGLPVEDFIANLKASDEFFLRGLYRNIFGRRADLAGLKYYMNQLSTGTATRASLQAHFKHTCDNALNGECPQNKPPVISGGGGSGGPVVPSQPSNLELIVKAYVEILDRNYASLSIDTEGIAYWLGRLNSGYPVTSFRNDLYASDEYFVRNAYKTILKRKGALAEVQYWLGEMKAGRKTRAQITADFKYACQVKSEACK